MPVRRLLAMGALLAASCIVGVAGVALAPPTAADGTEAGGEVLSLTRATATHFISIVERDGGETRTADPRMLIGALAGAVALWATGYTTTRELGAEGHPLHGVASGGPPRAPPVP